MTVFSNGGPPIAADDANRWVQTYPTAAALRGQIGTATSDGTPQQVNLQGLNASGDGLGGAFYWNANSTAADDNGVTTIVPSGSVQGAWIRTGFFSFGTGANTGLAIPMTTTVIAQLASLVLPFGGGWNVTGLITLVCVTGTVVNRITCGLSTSPTVFTTAVIDVGGGITFTGGLGGPATTFVVPPYSFSGTVGQTIYLLGQLFFTGGASAPLMTGAIAGSVQ